MSTDEVQVPHTPSPVKQPSSSKNLKDRAKSAEKSSSKKRKRHQEEELPDDPIQDNDSPDKHKKKKKRKSVIPQLEQPSTGLSSQLTTVENSQDEEQGPSPFFTQTYAFYLPLSPIAQAAPLEGLCAEHISPLILTYYPPLKSVVLSYSNARVTSKPGAASTSAEPVLATSFNEYAVSFAWLEADFVLFKPQKGVYMEGYVNVQNASHLGLICYNLFNASIDREMLPDDWTFEDGSNSREKHKKAKEDDAGEGGHFVNADGEKVDGLVRFRVRDVESLAPSSSSGWKGFIRIEGTLLSEDAEKELAAARTRKKKSSAGKARRKAEAPLTFNLDGDY